MLGEFFRRGIIGTPHREEVETALMIRSAGCARRFRARGFDLSVADDLPVGVEPDAFSLRDDYDSAALFCHFLEALSHGVVW